QAVVARIAGQGVGNPASPQVVVSVAARRAERAGPRYERTIAVIAAVEAVVSARAQIDVVAVPAEGIVAAPDALEPVVALATKQPVVAVAAIQPVTVRVTR